MRAQSRIPTSCSIDAYAKPGTVESDFPPDFQRKIIFLDRSRLLLIVAGAHRASD
jgi:hypothetical protein